MLSGSRNTITEPIGVSAIGEHSMPRAATALPCFEFGSTGDAEGEMIKAGPELIELVVIAALIFAYANDPARRRTRQDAKLDCVVVTGQDDLHPEQTAVPVRTSVGISNGQRDVMAPRDRRHMRILNPDEPKGHGTGRARAVIVRLVHASARRIPRRPSTRARTPPGTPRARTPRRSRPAARSTPPHRRCPGRRALHHQLQRRIRFSP